MPDPSREEVMAEVEKIAGSEMFLQSERLCRFLRFTVDTKLQGNAAQIKEYLLGREVFDRNGEYDPRTDPIVRVEARRLRKKLEEYYAGPGAQDTVRIEYPKGSYTPEFGVVGGTGVEGTKPKRWWVWARRAALLIGLALFVRYWVSDRRPAIAVIPARWVWQNDSFTGPPTDVDLAERIAAELANRHRMPVIAWPAMERFGSGKWTAKQIASEVRAARTLIVTVRDDAAGPRVTAYLLDAGTDQKLRVADEPNVLLGSADERTRAARKIADSIAVQ